MRTELFLQILLLSALLLMGSGCGELNNNNDDDGLTSGGNISIIIDDADPQKPVYSWSGSPVDAVELTRVDESGNSSIVWSIESTGTDDNLISPPLVHGQVPAGEIAQTVNVEPELTVGVFYSVMLTRVDQGSSTISWRDFIPD